MNKEWKDMNKEEREFEVFFRGNCECTEIMNEKFGKYCKWCRENFIDKDLDRDYPFALGDKKSKGE